VVRYVVASRLDPRLQVRRAQHGRAHVDSAAAARANVDRATDHVDATVLHILREREGG
jgi:hypothetical protein